MCCVVCSQQGSAFIYVFVAQERFSFFGIEPIGDPNMTRVSLPECTVPISILALEASLFLPSVPPQ